MDPDVQLVGTLATQAANIASLSGRTPARYDLRQALLSIAFLIRHEDKKGTGFKNVPDSSTHLDYIKLLKHA